MDSQTGSGETREVVRSNLSILNSVGRSPDFQAMYLTDPAAGKVFAWDSSAADGSLSNGRAFYSHEGPGDPDGCRLDVEGNVCHAIYGEGRVIKSLRLGTSGRSRSPQGTPPAQSSSVPNYLSQQPMETTLAVRRARGTEGPVPGRRRSGRVGQRVSRGE